MKHSFFVLFFKKIDSCSGFGTIFGQNEPKVQNAAGHKTNRVDFSTVTKKPKFDQCA